MKKCFIVSPIGDEHTHVRKRADQLFNHILEPACRACGFEADRIDLRNTADCITDSILTDLSESELVIADLTDHNPNVFFEVGYRKATGRPMIYLREKGSELPFDVMTTRALEYDLNNLDAVKEIKERLMKFIGGFQYNFGATEESRQAPAAELNQIVSLLSDLQAKVDGLYTKVDKKDGDTIKAVVEAVQSKIPPVNPQDQMIASLIMEMVKNPQTADSLIALGDKFGNQKN